MAADSQSTELIQVVALLAAGVVAVPIFKRLGLGSVLGYLTAGVIIGPFGLRLFTDPQAILHVAELGVVMFLFVIGLEMQPSRLWSLRGNIFGLGAAQVLTCGALLTALGLAAGLAPAIAFIAAMGFVLTSTAIVMQILEERGVTSTERGQRMVSILLLEDLAIVPLLAIVALLSPGAIADGAIHWQNIAVAAGSLAALLVAGRYVLNPMFRVLADSHAREVLTAAALLVVLGSALAMQLGGLSMAMGAFLAGVLLSESTFRHQLEADIEPFRGILLGLFFLSVGMSLDLAVMIGNWQIVLAAVFGYMLTKAAGIYLVARLFRATHRESIYRAALFAQGGEFAFVLYAAAAAAGIFDARLNAILTATIIVSMALTPVGLIVLRRLVPAPVQQSMEGVQEASNLAGSVLIIGFGRFGQVVSQSFLARGCDIAIIDTDTEMIRAAADFGFKIYYGDGTRLDVLRASGAGSAKVIAVCVDNRRTANRILELAKAEFPLAQTLVRSYDREHALELIQAGVDWQIRETFESAMKFGEEALRRLEVPEEELAEIMQRLRERDAERVSLEIAGGLMAGRALIQGNIPRPTPFTQPARAARPLSEETAAVTAKPEAG